MEALVTRSDILDSYANYVGTHGISIVIFLNTLFIYSQENLFSNTLLSVYILKFTMENFYIQVFYEAF